MDQHLQELEKGSIIKVGNGKRTHFWLDLWLGDSVFKDHFPHIYVVAKSPSSSVFKNWDGHSTSWVIQRFFSVKSL